MKAKLVGAKRSKSFDRRRLIDAKPSESAFDDPALGKHGKATFVAFDDLDRPWTGSLHLWPLIGAVAADGLDEGEA